MHIDTHCHCPSSILFFISLTYNIQHLVIRTYLSQRRQCISVWTPWIWVIDSTKAQTITRRKRSECDSEVHTFRTAKVARRSSSRCSSYQLLRELVLERRRVIGRCQRAHMTGRGQRFWLVQIFLDLSYISSGSKFRVLPSWRRRHTIEADIFSTSCSTSIFDRIQGDDGFVIHIPKPAGSELWRVRRKNPQYEWEANEKDLTPVLYQVAGRGGNESSASSRTKTSEALALSRHRMGSTK